MEITNCDIQFEQHGFKKRPNAFTELGVAMLSSVLNSKTAIQINRSIMRAIVTIRQSLINKPVGSVVELRRDFMGV